MALLFSDSVIDLSERCDRPRCVNAAVGFAYCSAHKTTYARCALHDGEKGAKRGLSAHNTMYHPKAGK